jgi:hypothetical protein
MNYVSFTESVLNFGPQNSILFCSYAAEICSDYADLLFQQTLPTHHVNPHSDDDDCANRHHLTELGDFHQVHAVANHGDEHRTEQAAPDAAASAKE